MTKETIYDAAIEFQDGGTSAVEGLTEKQYLQLQTVLKLIEHKALYRLTGRTHAEQTDWRARLNDLWQRANLWLMGEGN